MIARLLRLLDRDPDRLLVAGLALVALGLVATLRTLADAAGQWSETLPFGDRVVLGLYHTRPVHALAFLVGGTFVAAALRLRGGESGIAGALVAGVAWAYAALGAAGALAAVYCAGTGTFGEGVALVELTTRERTFGLAEQIVGSLAIAVAALAVARALLRPAEPEPVIGLDEEPFDDEPADEPVAMSPALAALAPIPDAAADAAPGAAEVALPFEGAPAAGSAEAAGDDDPEPEPEVLTPVERYRRLYDHRLRFSPRAAEARALLARLREDPDDEDAQQALQRMAAPDGPVH